MLRLATPVMNIAQEPEPCLLPTICRSPSTSLRSSATSSTPVQGSSVLSTNGSAVGWLCALTRFCARLCLSRHHPFCEPLI